MEETTFRILDTLSRELGNPLSINELTERIRQLHGTAYYANIYRTLHILAEEGAITLTRAGKSSIANLNFRNYRLLDLLTEMELRRKHELLKKKEELQILLMDLEARLRNMRLIESISLINPEKTLNLNRLELLILLSNGLKESNLQDYTITLYETTRQLQNMHNIKLDSLMLSFNDFLELLASDEINPSGEMLPQAITFSSPDAFWRQIAASPHRFHQIAFDREETNPAKITRHDLIYNLARFGYKEIGPKIEKGLNICIEYIITSIMIMSDARRIDAIPVLLGKNEANYRLLIFLSQKYGFEGRLLGLLRVLNTIKPTKENQTAIRILETMKAKEIRADQRSIQEKMRLYNAA